MHMDRLKDLIQHMQNVTKISTLRSSIWYDSVGINQNESMISTNSEEAETVVAQFPFHA